MDIPPPKPRPNRLQFLDKLGEATKATPTSNLSEPSTSRYAFLNFRISEEFHRSFKLASTHKGISMKELLEESFRLWVERNGLTELIEEAEAGVRQQRSRGRLERMKAGAAHAKGQGKR